jgi:hypothetical protein
VTKQDRAIKKRKKADQDVDAIIQESLSKVKAKRVATPSAPAPAAVLTKWANERVEGITDEQFALGVRCRELREEGEAWWAIARALELEGAGDSATTGKKGAARARNVYKVAFGSFPRTFKTGGYKGPVERNERVRELKAMKKKEARAIAKAGKSVIKADVPDEEVADMLRGRKIRWFSTEVVPDGMDYEACIHPNPHVPMYIIGEGDDRVIQFREQHRRAPVTVRGIPAQIRTVRLRQIYSVK